MEGDAGEFDRQEVEDRLPHRRQALLDRDDHVRLVGGQRLEGCQLRVEEGGRHEFVGAPGQVVGDDGAGTVEVDEERARCVDAQSVAVPAPQCRTGDERGGSAAELGRDRGQPRHPVGIGERNARGHLRLVLRGVQVIAVDECDPESLGDLPADDGLARPRHPHDDEWWKGLSQVHTNLSKTSDDIDMLCRINQSY